MRVGVTGVAGQPDGFAPAKVNLCLHVTGQRADGYHLLDSLVVFAAVGDVLQLQAEPGLRLSGPFGAELPQGGDNLVLRAARIAAPDADLGYHLEKNLPPASGIGGGSADAAAAVRLAEAWLQAQGRSVDRDLGALTRLGADIPVCLAGRATRMQGIGEVLTAVPALPEGWIVLVNPRIEVATPSVFKALPQKENPALPQQLPHWPKIQDLAQWLHQQRNDLEAPARALAPVIDEVLAALRAQPGQMIARMSGSGATCFALFAKEAEAKSAAATIERAAPDWWVAAAPMLG